MIASNKKQEGQNVKRIREMLGIKQGNLAFDLNISQQAISQLEQKECIEPVLLLEISKSLNVPVEAIKNFNYDQAVNIIFGAFNNEANGYNDHPKGQFNLTDKIIELYEAKIALYERWLMEKNGMIERLEKLIR